MSTFRRQSSSSMLWRVVAPYVRWPLYSPARLALVLALLVGLVAVAGRLGHAHDSSSLTARAGHPRTAASSAPAAPTDGASSPDPTPAAAASSVPSWTPTATPTELPPTASPVAVAEAFVTAWARRGAESRQWHAGVGVYTTSGFAGELASTDPQRIPATRRTGAGTLTEQRAGEARVTVPTDGGPVAVTLEHTPSGWQVSGIAPAYAAPAAPAPAMTRLPGPVPSGGATSAASAEG